MNLTREAQDFCLRGAARHAQGDLAGALADFDRALALSPDCPEIRNNRGAVRHDQGDLTGALADFDRALALNPGYPEAYQNRGVARHAQGDLAGALEDYHQALALNPRYAGAYHNRGVARHAQGDLTGALADLDRALELTPDHAAAEIYHDRGGARHALGDYAGALADYHRALEIRPRFCAAYISRGNARYHLRDLAGFADYRMAFTIDPQLAVGEVVRHLVADLRRDPVAVLSNCRKHLRINPDDLTAYARRCLTLLLLGRAEEAEPDLDQIRRRSPEVLPCLVLLVDGVKQHRGG